MWANNAVSYTYDDNAAVAEVSGTDEIDHATTRYSRTTMNTFHHGTPDDLEAFVAAATPADPVSIHLKGVQWQSQACRILARLSPDVNLHDLFLSDASIGDEGMELLAQVAALGTIQVMGIERCGITDAGVSFLAKSPHLANLTQLCLGNTNGVSTGLLEQISDAGAIALASCTNMANLQELNLSYSAVGDEGWLAIASSQNLPRLGSIYAWGTALTTEGAQRIKAAALSSTLGYCSIHTDYDQQSVSWDCVENY